MHSLQLQFAKILVMILLFLPFLKVSKSKQTYKYLFKNGKNCRNSKNLELCRQQAHYSYTPTLKIRKLFMMLSSRTAERLREFASNLCACKSCALFKMLFFPFPFFYVYEERIFSAYHFHFTQMNIGQKIKGKMRRRKSFLLSC